MNFNLLVTLLALIQLSYGLLALLATGFVASLLWPNPPGPEAHVTARGWAACLTAFGVLAWGIRGVGDSQARRLYALTLLVYCSIATVVWLLDAASRGWAPLGVLTFAIILGYALIFAYFIFVKPEAI